MSVSPQMLDREALTTQAVNKLKILRSQQSEVDIENLIQCIQDPSVSIPMLRYVIESADNAIQDKGKSDSALLKEYFFRQLQCATNITRMDFLKIIDDIESLSDLKYLSKLITPQQSYDSKSDRAMLLFVDWASSLSNTNFTSDMCTNLNILEMGFRNALVLLAIRTEIENKFPDIVFHLKNAHLVDYNEKNMRLKIINILTTTYINLKIFSPNDEKLLEIPSMIEAAHNKTVKVPMLILMAKTLLKEYFVELNKCIDELDLEYVKKKTQTIPSMQISDKEYLQMLGWSFEEKAQKLQELEQMNTINPLFFILKWYFITQHLLETKTIENSWIAREKALQYTLGQNEDENDLEPETERESCFRRQVNSIIKISPHERRVIKPNNNRQTSKIGFSRQINTIIERKSDEQLLSDAKEKILNFGLGVNLANGDRSVLTRLRFINEMLDSNTISRQMLIFINGFLTNRLMDANTALNPAAFDTLLIEYITNRLKDDSGLKRIVRSKKMHFCKSVNHNFDDDLVMVFFVDLRWLIDQLEAMNVHANYFKSIENYFDNKLKLIKEIQI